MRLRDLEAGVNRATGLPTRPSRDLTMMLARAYQVPPDHLLELAGYPRNRPDLGDDVGLLLAILGDLDAHHREMLLAIAKTIRESAHRSEAPAES